MIVKSAWSEQLFQKFEENQVVELELNYAKGWVGSNIDFLEHLTHLQALALLDWRIADIRPIEHLANLRAIQLTVDSKSKIDFNGFPLLEECRIEWNAGLKSVFDVKSLKVLSINRIPLACVELLSGMSSLRELTLFSCNTQSLSSIENLSRLEYLRLALFRKLQDNRFLCHLSQLRFLWIQNSKGFNTIESLNSPSLERLVLENVGVIESAKPLARLKNLRWFALGGNSKFADNDFSPLEGLPNLEKLIIPGSKGIDPSLIV